MCFNRNCLCLSRDERMINMPPHIEHRDPNVGACSNETAFPSSMRIPTTVSPSSFQFHVSSEEGINLCVDLSSNPSEWVEKLKSEVSICQNMSNSKSQTFHKDLGRFGESGKQIKSSFQLNLDAEKINCSHEHTASPSSLIIKENDQLQLDHPDGGNGIFASTVLTPCARAEDLSEHVGDQGLTSNKAHPDSQDNKHSNGASLAGDGCLITLDSNGSSPGEKLASDAVLNLLAMEHQNSKLEKKAHENSTLQNACNLARACGRIPGCLADGSLRIQMPEDVIHHKDVLKSPCENGEFVNLVDSEHKIYVEQGGHAGSPELEQGTCRNRLPTLVEEQVVIHIL
ncbi:hypothetical protein COLO4_07668 [Corchorus olitorius]|uniref:Uncharacterized protein n=1 Tax=Corchorus olitorius TaxID=93759 RepID=A0A1R3KIZ2_9ROSI|nr:hypothetical protein COLO4_07668 [Corchorus olitorius]